MIALGILLHLIISTEFEPIMRIVLLVALFLLWSARAAIDSEHAEFVERARIDLHQINKEHAELGDRIHISVQKIKKDPKDPETVSELIAQQKQLSASLSELAALKKQISGYAKTQQQRVEKAVADFQVAQRNHLQVINRWAELKDIHTNGGTEPILCHEEHQAALRDPLTKGPAFFDCATRVFKCKEQHPELLGEHFEQYKACLGATVLSRRRRR